MEPRVAQRVKVFAQHYWRERLKAENEVKGSETGTLEFSDPDAASHAHRFYRAKSR